MCTFNGIMIVTVNKKYRSFPAYLPTYFTASGKDDGDRNLPAGARQNMVLPLIVRNPGEYRVRDMEIVGSWN